MNMLSRTPTAALVLSILLASTAHASLIGDSIDVIYSNNGNIIDSYSTYDVVVGDGLEYYEIQGLFGPEDSKYTVDISASAIDIKFLGSSVKYYSDYSSFVGPSVLNLNDSSTLALTGFENFSAFDEGGRASDLTEGLIEFGDDWISFNFSGLAFTNDAIHIDLLFQGASPVPLPPAVWLFASGVLGLLGVTGFKKAA